MLVLGMASLASATLQISVNGVQNPVDSEIIIEKPSDTIILDVWTADDITLFELGTYALIVAEGPGTIDAANAEVLYGNILATDIPNANFLIGPGLAATYLGGFSGNPVAGDTFLDNILFHCDAEGDVIIELWTIEDMGGELYEGTVLMDSVIIHQIPEPMTLALLGLGGLFLRRRK
jgi:hypothetical protein